MGSSMARDEVILKTACWHDTRVQRQAIQATSTTQASLRWLPPLLDAHHAQAGPHLSVMKARSRPMSFSGGRRKSAGRLA